MNEILISVITSVLTFGGLWALLKETLTEALSKSISYKFDKKLQESKKLIDIELKVIDSQLKSSGAQVESLINNNLAALDFRRQKQVDAVEVLWSEMMQLKALIPDFISVLELIPSEFHDVFIQNMDIEKSLKEFSLGELTEQLKQSKAKTVRVFSGALMFSYYELYQSIIVMCLTYTSIGALDGKFSNWYEKYDIAATFPNINIDFNEYEDKLGKTQYILGFIEKSFLSDAEKIINGEVQMYEGNERAKQINEMRRQLASFTS